MLTEDRKYCKVFKQVLNEYLDREWMEPLVRYMNMSDVEKAVDLCYSHQYILKTFFDENDEFAGALVEVSGEDYETLESMDDYEFTETYYSLFENELSSFVDDFIEFCNDYLDERSWDNIPLYLVADYEGTVNNQWLVHMTDNLDGISKEGFSYGVGIDELAYTPARGTTKYKYSGGYNFAFRLSDAYRAEGTYGHYAVLFRASGIMIWHYGDEEHQVIFYGPSAHDIIIIDNDYGDWVIDSRITGNRLVRFAKLEDACNWAINNLPQYNRHLFGKVNPRVRQERNINKRKEQEKKNSDRNQYGLVSEARKRKHSLNEGYSSARYSKVISRFADQIVDMTEALKNGDVRGWKRTESNTYQSKLNFPLDNEKSVGIVLNFFADNDRKGNPTGGYDHNDDTIKLFLTPSKVTYERLYSILSHELTHKLDYDRLLDMDENGNAYVSHHFEVPKEKLPTCIRKVLYILWNTSEFNAWQSSYNMIKSNELKGLEALKYYIKQCGEINDTSIWTTVGEVLSETTEVEKEVWDVKNKYSGKSPQWIKKYFMRVSIDKYNKFAKKVVRWKGRNNEEYI